jgi:hypothetical protein
VQRPQSPTSRRCGRIQTDFYDIQRAIVQALLARKALRPDLDVTRATDILWTLNHPDLWQLLVAQRAWTPEQYEQVRRHGLRAAAERYWPWQRLNFLPEPHQQGSLRPTC